MSPRIVFFLILALFNSVLYLGLGVYLLTQKTIERGRWVATGFCFTVVGFYWTSLFLLPNSPLQQITPYILRIKWAIICFSPPLFFHLTTFYSPSRWYKLSRQILPLFYLSGGGFAILSLSSSLLIAGPLDRSPHFITGVVAGPLMIPFLIFATGLVGLGLAGLAWEYRTTSSLLRKVQVLYLLLPTVLNLIAALMSWVLVIGPKESPLPRELLHLETLLIGVFLIISVVRYGAFTGRPANQRQIIYSMGFGFLSLVYLNVTLAIDRVLMQYVPFPIITGSSLIIAVAGFPAISRTVTRFLDQHLFTPQRHLEILVARLKTVLDEKNAPEQLPHELLEAICLILNVDGGFVALRPLDTPADNVLRVIAVKGQMGVEPGSQIPVSPFLSNLDRPYLPSLSPATPALKIEGAALICPVKTDKRLQGILVLGKKKDGVFFSRTDLHLCRELTRPLSRFCQTITRQNHLSQSSGNADEYYQSLHRLVNDITFAVENVLSARMVVEAPQPRPGDLEIRLLGPFRVLLNGQPIPEAAWKTGKAKALLAYLLWKGESGASRDELIAALWPERTPEEAANIFHVTLHHLRRALEPDLKRGRHSSYIQFEEDHYLFNLEAPHWIDTVVFEQLAASREVARLDQAVRLYRGPYLNGLDWDLPLTLEVERRRFERLYLDILRRLAVVSQGRVAESYLEKLLAVEPADEAAQQTLVL
ncbi:MAG: hypothetical protein D6784_17465, partial [Chloroflexi bacterium]